MAPLLKSMLQPKKQGKLRKPPARAAAKPKPVKAKAKVAAPARAKSKSAKKTRTGKAAPPQPQTALATVQQLTRTSARSLTGPAERAVAEVFAQIPRTEIIAALQRTTVGDATQMTKLTELLASSEHAELEWPTLCRHAGVDPRDLLRAIVDSYTADGELLVARRLPLLLDGLAAAGIERLEDCAVCNNGDEDAPGPGLVHVQELVDDKLVTLTKRCGLCVRGKIVVPADLAAAKLALEAVGVLGQKGPAMQINQQFVGGKRGGPQLPTDSGAPDMSEWSRSTDAVYEERRPQQFTDAEEAQ